MSQRQHIFRDYQKNDAQRLELLQRNVHEIRGLLSPAGRAIFDRELSAWPQGGPLPRHIELTWGPITGLGLCPSASLSTTLIS